MDAMKEGRLKIASLAVPLVFIIFLLLTSLILLLLSPEFAIIVSNITRAGISSILSGSVPASILFSPNIWSISSSR